MRPRHRVVRSLDKDLLLSSEFDGCVRNAIGIRQMQQAEFATAVHRECSRHQGVTPGGEVGASHPCEAKCDQADHFGESTFQFHS